MVYREKMDENKEIVIVKKFRLCNEAFTLTYKGWLVKEDIIKFIKNIVKKEIKFIRCAHETGKDGYKHTHVLVRLTEKWDCRDAGHVFDLVDGTHPHIKKIMMKGKHLENSMRYLAKEDPENKDLLEWKTEKPGSITVRIKECRTKNEAIDKFAVRQDGTLIGSNVNAIEKIWAENLDDYESKIEDKLFDWQKWLINRPNNDREIIWIYDKIGGGGKTEFGKYIQSKNMGIYMVGSGNGFNNVATYAQTMRSQGKNIGWWIINMTRSDENNDEIYRVIEGIKDGILTSTKYAGVNMLIKGPKVVVMSNSLPNIKKISRDRWCILRISKGKEKCFEKWVSKKKWEPVQ